MRNSMRTSGLSMVRKQPYVHAEQNDNCLAITTNRQQIFINLLNHLDRFVYEPAIHEPYFLALNGNSFMLPVEVLALKY